MNIENAIKIYLDWKKSHAQYAPSRYRSRLEHFGNFLGKAKSLKTVTGNDVIRYHLALEKEEYVKGGIKMTYSKGTVAYSCHILKNFFLFWHGRRESEVNHKEILPMRYVVPLKRVISEDEFKCMDASLDKRFFEQLKKKVAINLLWDTGMRVSELCEMDLSHIQAKHETYGLRTAIVRTRKTMRYNLVAWSKETDDLLTAYLGLRVCIDAKTDGLFIRGSKVAGKRITTRTVQRWINEISAMAGLGKGITPHSFRHGKGHAMLNKPNSNLRDVSAVLRHSRPESSYHYLNLSQEKYLEIASKYLNVA